jgi:hypothetical protein
MVWRSTHACRVHQFRHDPLSIAAENVNRLAI